MVARVIGIGLLIILGLPLALAFAPFLILGLGIWFLATRWWRGRDLGASLSGHLRAALEWRPGTGWHPSELVNHTHLRDLGRPVGRRHGAAIGALPALAGVVVFFALVDVVARQAPYVLVPFLVAGTLLGLQGVMRRQGRSAEPGDVHASMSAPPPLDAAEFEQRVARLLHEGRFHSLQQIGQPGRPGINLIARDQDNRLFLVECRQLTVGNRVGSADVRRLIETVERERAAGGIFVTAGGFTQAAINLAQYSRAPILLYDGQALARFSAPVAWPDAIRHATGPYARATANR